MWLALAIHRLLIRLYPRPFRDRFAAEMSADFQERAHEAAAENLQELFRMVGLELRDWPLACWRAHWQARQEHLAEPRVETLSGRQATAAALPHFLFAFFVTLSSLLFLVGFGGNPFIAFMAREGFLIALLLVLLLAWWRGWPTWSVAWIGYLLFMILIAGLPSQLFNQFAGTSAQSRFLQIVFAEVGPVLLWLAALYFLLLRWPRAGLVAMLPAIGMTWILYLEFTGALVSTMVVAGTWVWLGIMTLFLLRNDDDAWDVWILYAAGLGVGAIFVFTGHYLTEAPVRSAAPRQMLDDLLTEFVPVMIPLVTILLLHTLRTWSARRYDRVPSSFRWLAAGVIIFVIVGRSQHYLLQGSPADGVNMAAMALLVVLILAGYALALAALRAISQNMPQDTTGKGWPLWVIGALLLLLPLIFEGRWLPGIVARTIYHSGGPPELDLSNYHVALAVVQQLSFVGGILWLLVAAAAITTVRRRLPPYLQPEVRAANDDLTQRMVASSSPVDTEYAAKRTPRRSAWSTLILVALAILLLIVPQLPASLLIDIFARPEVSSEAYSSGLALFLLLAISLSFVVASLLLRRSLSLWRSEPHLNASADRRLRRTRGGPLALAMLALLLIARALFSLFWFMVWDSTVDPLDFLWLPIPVAAASVAAIVLALKSKWAGAALLLTLMGLITFSSAQGKLLDKHRLTGQRAAQIVEALESYRERHGRYPQKLNQLPLWKTVAAGGPLVMYGQTWCYQAGRVDYRLGYLDREHWSDPRIIGRIYAATPGAPLSPPLCKDAFEAMQERNPDRFRSYWKDEAA